jgi:hypothetical protein
MDFNLNKNCLGESPKTKYDERNARRMAVIVPTQRCSVDAQLRTFSNPPMGLTAGLVRSTSKRVARNERARSTQKKLGSDSGLDVDAASFLVEVNISFDQGENREVIAHAHIAAWVPLRTYLADQDVAWEHLLSTELFHSTSLGV